MFFDILFDLAGRLHPALVHLPIGILLLACCFDLVSGSPKFAVLRPAVGPMFFWGMISALLAMLSGLALASGGDYTDEQVDTHKISGIILAVLSVAVYILYRTQTNRKLVKTFSAVTLASLVVTGHLGGSITHGEDYIAGAFEGTGTNSAPLKPIPDIEHALAYNGVVQPIFEARCYNCHSDRKQKGKLRLDNEEFIVKGGKSKHTVVAGKPEESELVKRLLLPLDDEDHMPPKGKPQLTKEQIDYLQWWVSTGVDFKKKVGELPQTESLKPTLVALETGTSAAEEMADVPGEPVAPADSSIINRLNRAGVALLPVSRESNYLTANFITAGSQAPMLINELLPLKKQLVSLKLDGAELHDSTMNKVAQLTALRRLQISHTPVTDNGIQFLSNLAELRSLNLVDTRVTAKGLAALKNNKNIKNIYVYQTGISEAEVAELKNLFPKSHLEFGNYQVPTLETDTTEVKF
jgi:uncharacterized membrane protein/mono/diheme cytochrome c family protein